MGRFTNQPDVFGVFMLPYYETGLAFCCIVCCTVVKQCSTIVRAPVINVNTQQTRLLEPYLPKETRGSLEPLFSSEANLLQVLST